MTKTDRTKSGTDIRGISPIPLTTVNNNNNNIEPTESIAMMLCCGMGRKMFQGSSQTKDEVI